MMRPFAIGEGQLAVGEPLQGKAALVDQPVVGRTKQGQVLRGGGAAVGPMLNVMGVDEEVVGAARKAAAAVAPPQSQAQGRRDCARAPPQAAGASPAPSPAPWRRLA